MIPEGWKNHKLGRLVKKIGSGITPKGGREVYLDRGIPLIRSQNVLWGKLSIRDVAYISLDQHNKMRNTQLEPNDVLLNITGASIGRSCVFPEMGTMANVNQHVCIIRTAENLDPVFLSGYLNSQHGQNQILSLQAGGNRQGLNFEQIRNFDILLPPLPEQCKIAEILGAWDESIALLEKLITAKRKLKQGLMQQLLTGKKRFKEFEGSEWKIELLGEFMVVKDGVHQTPTYTKSGIPFLRVTDIQNDIINLSNTKYINKEEHEKITAKIKPRNGDILYSKNGTIGITRIVDWDWEFSFFVSLALLRFKKNGYSIHYLAQYLQSDLAKREIYQGSKQGSVINLHLEEIQKFRVPIPPLPEQEKIASVLSAADTEISNLEKQLAAYKQQKRGLMQQLLTGKTRVRVN